MTITTKYKSGINRLVTEDDRIKLPKLVKNIKYNPSYMIIDADWSSSWNEVTKSRLIESLIINIPVIPIIVWEKKYNSYQLIDGRERLKTVVDFYSDRLILNGLEVETDLEGCNYSTLPKIAKEQLDRRSLFSVNCIPMNDDLTESELNKLIGAVNKRYAKF